MDSILSFVRTRLLPIFLFLFVVMLFTDFSMVSGQVELSGADGRLWVTNRSLNNVTVFDAATGQVLAVIGVGRRPIGIIAPKDTGKVYVLNEDDDTVSVISKATMTRILDIPVGDKPHHVSASPDGRRVYVAEFGTNIVGVIDTALDVRIAGFATTMDTGDRSHAPHVTTNGHIILVANSIPDAARDEIVVLDARNGEQLWALNIGAGPNEIVTTHNARIGYVSVRNENMLKAIDLEMREIIASAMVDIAPETLQLSKNEKLLVVSTRKSPARIAVFDVSNALVLTKYIDLPGALAAHNTLTPNARYSFVAMEGNPTYPAGIAVVDHSTNEWVDVYLYPGGGSPHGIIFEPAADLAVSE